MRKLTLLISAICCILFVSCTTKETIINNYNTSSPIDDNWIVINDPYGASHGQFFITQNGGLFLICYNPHFKSFDGGKTWTKFTMDSIYNFAFYEGKNNIIYDFNPVSYPEIFDKLVMKSTDEGNTWLKINYPAIDTTGKKNLAVNSFDVCKNGDLLLVYNWNTYNYNDYNMYGCMFRSKDDGNSWSIVKNGNDSLNQIYFIRTGSKDHIYAQQSYYNKKTYSYDYRYISSTDNGYNWQTGSDNLFVYASIIDSAGIIYQRNKVGISKSTDNGYTYNALNYRFFGDIAKLAVAKNGNLFCATTFGLYKSTDKGDSWQPLLQNYSGIGDLAISPDGYIYFRGANYILYRSKQQIAN